MPEYHPRHWLIPLLAFLIGILLLLAILHSQPDDWLAFLLGEETHAGLFLLFMALLPMVGFPISPFLVLVGIKFSLYPAIVFTGIIFALHLWMSYLLAHSVLRPMVNKILARTDYRIPRIRQQNHLHFALVFMAVPGLPYAVKNYFLASLNIPFRIYFPVGLGCNLILALPLIGLGHTILDNPRMAVLFLLLLGCGYVSAVWLKRRLTSAERTD